MNKNSAVDNWFNDNGCEKTLLGKPNEMLAQGDYDSYANALDTAAAVAHGVLQACVERSIYKAALRDGVALTEAETAKFKAYCAIVEDPYTPLAVNAANAVIQTIRQIDTSEHYDAQRKRHERRRKD